MTHYLKFPFLTGLLLGWMLGMWSVLLIDRAFEDRPDQRAASRNNEAATWNGWPASLNDVSPCSDSNPIFPCRSALKFVPDPNLQITLPDGPVRPLPDKPVSAP